MIAKKQKPESGGIIVYLFFDEHLDTISVPLALNS